MNHTDYTQQNVVHTKRLTSRSGRVCAVMTPDGAYWAFPDYRHPGPNASEGQRYAAHMARCVPVKAVELAEQRVEYLDRYFFWG